MQYLYPEVGLSGAIRVATPFETVVIPQVLYECIAVQSLQGLLADGEDPFNDYYEPMGVDEQRFQDDVAIGAKIVTLRSTDGEIVRLPNSFILNLPDANGVRYTMTMLGVNLTALPEDYDLETLKADISDLVMSRIGLPCEVREMVYSSVSLLTPFQHESVKSFRQDKVKNGDSNLKRYLDLKTSFEALQEKTKRLETYIESNFAKISES